MIRGAVAIAALACAPLWCADSKTEASRLLNQVKAASGGDRWDRIRTWHEHGTFHAGDLAGSHEGWIDFKTFRVYADDRASSPILGDVRTASGWNGKASWSADQSGDVYSADSEEARSAAIGDAYIEAFGYLFPARHKADFDLESPRTAGGKQYDVVLVSPRDTDPFELWIDRGSHFVVRAVETKGIDKVTSFFSDFREVAGVTVPFKRVDVGEKAAGPEQSWQLTSVEINTAAPAGIFDAPAAHFNDVTFPPGKDSVTLDFDFKDEQIYLPVSLNGNLQDKFVFDIGSTDSIDRKKAAELGLKAEIVGTGYGGGAGSVVQGLTKINRVEIGGLRFDDQLFDTTEIGSADSDPDGMIGYEVARRTVVVIDYDKHQITFMKPEKFRPPAHATAVPFRFASQSEVAVQASVDGLSGEFQIDTGAGNSLMINRPFAERHGLVARYKAAREVSVAGIGGEARSLLFRPNEFMIASMRLPPPVGQIFVSESGGGVEEHIAGNIGNGILKRFTLTLDYAHRMIYFEPNSHFNDPDVFNQGWSGLKLGRDGSNGVVEVVESEPDSPAALAGIRAGDTIVALNGSPIEKYTNDQLNEILNSGPGTTLRMTIQRNGETRDVALTIKPMI